MPREAHSNREAHPVRRTAPAGAIFAILTLGGIALSPLLLAIGAPGACAFQARFAIPCPTCFTTRAFASLATGDVARAFATQPLLTAGALAVVTWGVWDWIRWRSGREAPLAAWVSRRRGTIAFVLPAAVGLNWIWLILR